MTDSFLVSFVWVRPKNWRRARCNMKERFHSFKWHRKILFYVHSNFIPAAAELVFFFLDSFMSCHCIFKTIQVSKSQCVTGRVTRKRKNVLFHWQELKCEEWIKNKTDHFC